MEDYLYIIIGIAWVAYSIYNSRQKALKKQAQRRSGGEPSQSTPLPGGGGKTLFEDIFRELTGEIAPAPPVTQPANPAKYPPYEEFQQTNDTYKSSSVQPIIRESFTDYTRKEPVTPVKTHSINKQVTKNESLARKFNLREAVIFSELLNRKYF
jgi:hypothetical protein